MSGLKLTVAPKDGPVFLGKGDTCTTVSLDRIVRSINDNHDSIWLSICYGRFHGNKKHAKRMFIGETIKLHAEDGTPCSIEFLSTMQGREAVMLSFEAPKSLSIDRSKVRMSKETSRVGLGQAAKQISQMMPFAVESLDDGSNVDA